MDTSAPYDHSEDWFDISPNTTPEERLQIAKDVEELNNFEL